MIDAIKKAIEFEWQAMEYAGEADPPTEHTRELAAYVEGVTGERFNFETGKWEPSIALPWTMPMMSRGRYAIMDADSRTICMNLRKVDAEFIIRTVNEAVVAT